MFGKSALLLFLFFSATLFGQLYDTKLYTDENGLAQNYVYSISQDKRGFLLIGTGEGFNIFMGDKFATYTVNDGLAENFVTCHYTSPEQTVIGHFQGGITIFQHNRFRAVKLKELEGVKINGIFRDRRRNLIIYTQGKGLFRFDGGKKLTECPNPISNGINFAVNDQANNYLMATNDGLVVMNYDDPSKPREIGVPSELKYKTVLQIVQGNEHENMFWVTVEGEGMYCILRRGNEYVINNFISAMELEAREFKSTSLMRDHEQNLWIGFLGEGVRKITFTGTDKNSWNITKINEANGIENKNIQQVFEDAEGNTWFGTFGGGLYLKTIQPFVYYSSRNGLVNSNVRAVTSIDNNQTVLIGHEKGITAYNLLNNQVKNLNGSSGFVTDEVSCLTKTAEGTIWIGTKSNGVYTYDPRTQKFTAFTKAPEMRGKAINSIEITAYGLVYIGTSDGLYIYNSKTGFINLLTTLDGLMHNNVRFLFLDSHNRLWIASPGSPPYYYLGGKLRIYKDIDGLKNYKVTSYTEDSKGSIWIGTEGDGCFRFRDGTFSHFSVGNKIKSNYVYGIAFDGRQNVWLTHKNGLSKINIDNLKANVVDRSHGNLRFTESNMNSFHAENNTIFFGTTSGLVVYYNDPTTSSRFPTTSIRGIFFDGKLKFPGSDMRLSYKKYNVSIHFKGILFSDQADVVYKYRLVGLDEVWRTTSNDYVDFPKLPDGTYTFELLSANPDGVWAPKPVTITFSIRSPFWKTWWFYLLTAVAIVFVITFIIRFRLRKLKEIRTNLEMVVESKTRELQEEKNNIELIKNELEEKNKDITDSINYALKIQEAILPEHEDITRCFPDSTIFSQPRDIVSGDFYWFHETQEYAYYAMVDCTGHGIPGAFMSLIGSTLLDEIVANGIDIDPASVLSLLNKRIVLTLKQGSGKLSRDGMDMILCRFAKETGKLMYASAGRPLYLVSGGELTAHRASRVSIGGNYDFMKNEFENEEVQLKKGDLLVMFSDGFSDQFGEAVPKKFSSKRVKELCLKIADMPKELRSEVISDAFFDWKGSAEQIDDVLFISVKI